MLYFNEMMSPISVGVDMMPGGDSLREGGSLNSYIVWLGKKWNAWDLEVGAFVVNLRVNGIHTI